VNAALARELPRTVLWRPMTESDIDEVATLERVSHAAPWTAGNFRDALAAGYGMAVGLASGRICAYGVLLFAPGEAQILNLTVAPEARRLGLGFLLTRKRAAPPNAFSKSGYRTCRRSSSTQARASCRSHDVSVTIPPTPARARMHW